MSPAEAAVLDHKIGVVIEIYAEQHFEKAKQIMRQIA